jgi:hypothetical protein
MIIDSDMYLKCALKATQLLHHGYFAGKIEHEDLTKLLIKLETEKLEKEQISDTNIEYNDTVVSIEYVGELETKDISVSGDNLFYCNGILTKNSFGLPATADLMFALISTEELEQLNQLMIKQLKNRYNDPTIHKRFVIGIDRAKMRLYNAESSAQDDIVDDTPAFNNSKFGNRMDDERKSRIKSLIT